jgi:hypothetical protein
MNELSTTRAGGDSGANPRKFQGFPRVDTAGAPAFGVETGSSAPPQWIQLIPAGTFQGRDGRGPYLLSDPDAVIAATMALRMRAGIPIDYDHATDFAATDGRPRDGLQSSRFAAAPSGAGSNGPIAPRARSAPMSIATSRRSFSTRPATAPSRGCCGPVSPTIQIST